MEITVAPILRLEQAKYKGTDIKSRCKCETRMLLDFPASKH